MTIAKAKSSIDGKQFLQDAFALEQELLQVKLKFSTQSVPHPTELGDVNESHFVKVLRKYLPQRYAVHKGMIIDSTGATSHQIDVIIYDNQYTPTLLDQENHRFVPAEAVYAVFEVKPTINKKHLKYAGDKAESVRRLRRTSVPIVHAAAEKPAQVKPLFPIVAGIIAGGIEWKDGFEGQAFQDTYRSLTDNKCLDCGLAVSGSYFDSYNNSWEVGTSDQALAYFIFRLLQKLQSLGTVPAVDWNAYASVLRDKNPD